MLGIGLDLRKQNYISSFEGPLDKLGNVSDCVLGISPYKRLTRNYDDWLVLVVRVNDLEEQYFYPDSNGDIDSAEIIAWLDGSNGVVKQIANQVKTAYPAYQNTIANMPRIVNSGVFDSDGLYLDGLNDVLKVDDYTEIQITSPPFSLYVNTLMPSGASGYVIMKNYQVFNDSSFRCVATPSSIYHVLFTNNVTSVNVSLPIVVTDMFAWRDKNTNGVLQKVNGVEDLGTYAIDVANQPYFRIGARSASADGNTHSVFYLGNIKNVLMFDSNEYPKYDDFVEQGL